LSHLGHGFGSSDLKLICDPSKLLNLKKYKTKQINMSTIARMEAIGYADSTKHAIKIFDFYGIQLFSSFVWNNKTLYMVHWQERTFIAEIYDNNILIVDPLFNSDLYTHDPITKRYESGDTLINMDHYGTGGEREVSMLLIKGREITKIDWNEKH
jgi:hypothetical protein